MGAGGDSTEVGYLHCHEHQSSWIPTLQLVRETLPLGGKILHRVKVCFYFIQMSMDLLLTFASWLKCRGVKMKLDLLQLFQFSLRSAGRSRRGREGMLHLQHDSPCMIRMAENKTGVLVHAQFPCRAAEHSNPRSLWFPRQLNLMCTQQWNHRHWLLLLTQSHSEGDPVHVLSQMHKTQIYDLR